MGTASLTFNHDPVECGDVATRYVAGSLAVDQLHEFESHLAICGSCADEVALARLFAKPITVGPVVPPRRSVSTEGKGIFDALAAFRPAQQWAILGAVALFLLCLPMMWSSWQTEASSLIQPQSTIWLRQSDPASVTLPRESGPVVITAEPMDRSGVFRLSIIDLQGQAIWRGPDQTAEKGAALGLRVPTLPDGLSFGVVELRSQDGTYRLITRYPIFVERP